MIARTIVQILRHGYNTLKTAVVGGQYDRRAYSLVGMRCRQHLEPARQCRPSRGRKPIVHIDYTGLGKSGTYALLVDTDAGSAQHIRFRDAYGDRVPAWDADHGVAYKIRGGLPEAVRLFGADRVITCEFGTLPALKVLKALRRTKPPTGAATSTAKAGLLAAFRPGSSKWERHHRGGTGGESSNRAVGA